MKTTKKILAILLAVTMILALAACGKKPVEQTSKPGVDEEDPRMIGMLVFSTEAVVNISYDQEGNVLAMEGHNTEGVDLVGEMSDYEGKPCADIIATLLKSAASKSLVLETVVIKQSFGSNLPNDKFLDDLVSKAQAAADTDNVITNVIAVGTDKLDENGYINLDTAKTILLQKLGLDKASTLDGVPTPDGNGEYMIYLEEGNLTGTFMVNAITGLTRQLTEDELREMEGVGEEDIPADVEENFDNLPTEEAASGETTAATEVTIPELTEPSEPAETTEAQS